VSRPEASGEILILTGPPGSGKTTTARALAAGAARRAVHLHADDFWDAIRCGWIEPWLTEAHGQNTVVMAAVAAAAGIYAAGGYLVVVDGVVGPWFLAPFEALAAPVHYVVLRPSLETALARAAAREEGLTDPRPISALHRQFHDLGGLERCVIDSTGRSTADTLAAVRDALASGAFLLR
jgi:chloramphenicol 3-O-phosphotransferase